MKIIKIAIVIVLLIVMIVLNHLYMATVASSLIQTIVEITLLVLLVCYFGYVIFCRESVETYVDKKSGKVFYSYYRNKKLKRIKVFQHDHLVYEAKYGAHERIRSAKSYDEKGKTTLKIRYYSNGEIKSRKERLAKSRWLSSRKQKFNREGNKL